MANIECCHNILSSKGLKSTTQRVAVLNALLSSNAPLTANDIYMSIHDCEDDHLSLSTVYRVLDALIEKEIITKTGLIDGGKALFEVVTGMHRHNMICVKCHKMIPVGDCPLGEFEKNLEDTTGFRISGHKLEIYGVCRECRLSKQ